MHKTVSHRITQYHTISYHFTTYHTISQRTTPYRIVSHRTTRYNTVSHRIAQYHTVSHRITPHHTEFRKVEWLKKPLAKAVDLLPLGALSGPGAPNSNLDVSWYDDSCYFRHMFEKEPEFAESLKSTGLP